MPMTGAVLGSKCYNTPAEAVDAFYSGAAPVLTSGSTSYLTEFVKESGLWKVKQWTISSTGVTTLRYTQNAPVPTFPACDPSEKFFDGVTIGWGIATAMILVSALMLARRGARSG